MDSRTPEQSVRFAQVMAVFGLAEEKPFIAAAVSGGGDSMAMALLLDEWAKARGGRILALTVDHGLRAGSRAEAEKVAKILAARDIAHKILTWEDDKPATRIEEKARRARYDLLLSACQKHSCSALAVAHNLEDQVETFWMRLAHGSGLDGLAGMAAARSFPSPGESRERGGPVAPKRSEGGREGEGQSEHQLVSALSPTLSRHTAGEGAIVLLRPLLSFTRAELREVCKAAGVAWVEDPLNKDEKFLRVRLRKFEELLTAEGLTPQRLSRTMDKIARARAALEFYAYQAFEECVVLEKEGALLNLAPVLPHPREIQSRVLAAALDAVNPQEYAPGAEALDALLESLLSEDFRGRTLAGCVLSPYKGKIRIGREKAA